MDRHVLVSLLEPVVLLDVVEIVASHYNRPVHLHLGDDSCQDSSADRNLNIFRTTQSFPHRLSHLASEGTLLVNVTPVFGLIGDLEAEAGVAEEPGLRWLQSSLLVEEDGGLLLEGPFVLIGHNWI